MVVMERPRTVSLSLLFLLASIALSELAILLSDPIRFEPDLGLLLAFYGHCCYFEHAFQGSEHAQ